MTEETRIVECHACGADVTFATQYGYDGPDIHCDCGEAITNHAKAVADAKARLTAEEAIPIAAKYTYDQIMDVARKLYDDPASATSDELDALAAFRLLRYLDMPCCADEKLS